MWSPADRSATAVCSDPRPPAPRRLIVTADDMGADEARNEGILAAIDAGAVTSVSLLANGPALEHALGRLRAFAPRVSLGVHLNLSEGAPLVAGHRRLVGPDGTFRGKVPARCLLQRRGDRALEVEVEREVAAQIGRLRAAVGPLDHLDGHQHVHLFPAVSEGAVAAAAQRGIRWIRIPQEPWPAEEAPNPLAAEIQAFLEGAREARALVRARGLAATDHFRGLFLRDRLTAARLEALVTSLPEGLTELMVHPGRTTPAPPATPFSRFSTAQRERELEALLDPAFRAASARAGVTLTPFPAPG